MTPAERLAALERLDRTIRERNTWTDLRALGAYEDLWEMAYGAAYQAVQVAAAARHVVERDGPWEPVEQPEPDPHWMFCSYCYGARQHHSRHCRSDGTCCETPAEQPEQGKRLTEEDIRSAIAMSQAAADSGEYQRKVLGMWPPDTSHTPPVSSHTWEKDGTEQTRSDRG